jgi:hypothetical protein
MSANQVLADIARGAETLRRYSDRIDGDDSALRELAKMSERLQELYATHGSCTVRLYVDFRRSSP